MRLQIENNTIVYKKIEDKRTLEIPLPAKTESSSSSFYT